MPPVANLEQSGWTCRPKREFRCFLLSTLLDPSQSGCEDQSEDKQVDSPEWVTHAGFVTLILTVPFAQSARFVRLRQVFQRRDTI